MSYKAPRSSNVSPTDPQITEETKPLPVTSSDMLKREANVSTAFPDSETFSWPPMDAPDFVERESLCSTRYFHEGDLELPQNSKKLASSSSLDHPSTSSCQISNGSNIESTMSSSPQNDLIQCQFCSSLIPLKHMSKHINVSHPSCYASSSSSSTLSPHVIPSVVPENSLTECNATHQTLSHPSTSSSSPKPPSWQQQQQQEQGKDLSSSHVQEYQEQIPMETSSPTPHGSEEIKRDIPELYPCSVTSSDEIEPCSICRLTFDTAEEAADHEMAHRLQAEEDAQMGSSDSEHLYHVILSNFHRTLNTVASENHYQEDNSTLTNNNQGHQVTGDDHEINNTSHHTSETTQSQHDYTTPVVSFVPGLHPTIRIATSLTSREDQTANSNSSNNGYTCLISPIALLTEQLVSGASTLSLDEWISRLRFGDNTTENQPVANQNVTPQNIIENLPVHTYKNISPAEYQTLDSLDLDPDVCMVCLDEYSPEDQLYQLPCLHYFHVRCIDAWLKRSTLCPACKRTVISTVPPPKSATETDANVSE